MSTLHNNPFHHARIISTKKISKLSRLTCFSIWKRKALKYLLYIYQSTLLIHLLYLNEMMSTFNDSCHLMYIDELIVEQIRQLIRRSLRICHFFRYNWLIRRIVLIIKKKFFFCIRILGWEYQHCIYIFVLEEKKKERKYWNRNI
jgi:hypothetical protein